MPAIATVPQRLPGKVCLVTGTGGSIGRATALRFAAEGASVAHLTEPGDCRVFLASDESSYVTGVDIVVDGGMKVW